MDQLVVHLQMFDGPLDLLLHLIRRAEVAIEDVFVSEITSQYLEIIEQAKELDMQVAGEFITMAAMLLEIKSRSLLPKPEPEYDENGEEEQNPEEALIRQLTLYNMFKEISDPLRDLEKTGTGMRYKLPEEILPQTKELDLDGVTGETLSMAFENVLLRVTDRAEASERRRIVADNFTVQDRMARIRRIMRKRGTASFTELFDEDSTREEVVVTFVAMLELLKNGRLKVKQKKTFSDIALKWVEQTQ